MENTVIVDDFGITLINDLREIKKQISLLSKEEDEIKMLLRDKVFKDSEHLVSQEGEILASYKFIPREIFDSKSFKNDNPDLHDQYLKSIESRVLFMK